MIVKKIIKIRYRNNIINAKINSQTIRKNFKRHNFKIINKKAEISNFGDI